MRKFIFKGLKIAACIILAATVISTNVHASDDISDKDASGNLFCAGQNVNVTGDEKIQNELFAAGMMVNVSDVKIDGSVFTAGQNVSLKNAKSGGSVFVAGSNVTLDVDAKNNIWAVGNVITTSNDTKVKGLHIAGNTVSVDGEYDAVSIAGSTVTFNAVVKGDVSIEANEIIIGDDAKIGGNLKIVSEEDPKASDVVGGKYEFEKSKSEDTEDEGLDVLNGNTGKALGKAAFGVILLKKVKSAFFNLFKYAVLAVVLAVVFKKNLSDSYEYATKRPGAFWGFGALILMCFPVMAIVLCVTVIGIPVAGLASAFYIFSICIARVFTFASLGRELIFSHTKKRLNPIAECVLAVLPAAIIKVIPVVGGIVGFACAIYMIGYVCLAFADTISKESKPIESGMNNTVSE